MTSDPKRWSSRHLTTWFAAAVLIGGLARGVRAHDPQLSGISILLQGNVVIVNATTHLSRLAQAEHAPAGKRTTAAPDFAVRRRLRRRLRLRLNDRAFAPGAAHIIRDDYNDLVIWQARLTLRVTQVAVLAPLYPLDATARTVVVLLRDGQATQEALLDAGHPLFRATAPLS